MSIQTIIYTQPDAVAHLLYPILANDTLRYVLRLRIDELNQQLQIMAPPDDPLQYHSYISTIKATQAERDVYNEILAVGNELVQRFSRSDNN